MRVPFQKVKWVSLLNSMILVQCWAIELVEDKLLGFLFTIGAPLDHFGVNKVVIPSCHYAWVFDKES